MKILRVLFSVLGHERSWLWWNMLFSCLFEMALITYLYYTYFFANLNADDIHFIVCWSALTFLMSGWLLIERYLRQVQRTGSWNILKS